MPTSRLLALMLLTIFVSAAAAQESANKKQDGKLATPKVELDNTKITLPCRPGQSSRVESCSDSTMIIAKVIIAEGTPKDVEVQTIVSGGRIVSKKGAEFHWDLAGVYPGTYTVSVAATDGNGKWSDQVTREVQIVECPACGFADACPVLTLEDADPVAVGELMEFKLKVSGKLAESATYNWSVSAGTIESGQGTPTIKVRTEEYMENQSVTATVEIAGVQFAPMCQLSASASGAVTAKKPK